MSHEVETMFSVREKPWHGLGTILAEYPGREEAMELAGHNFEVVERQLEAVETRVGPDGDKVEFRTKIKGAKALFNGNTGEEIKVVNNSYGVVQNETLWDIVDALVEVPNVKYETAGVLRGGAVLWVLAKLDEPFQIPGDNSLIFPYITAKTSHDGTHSCTADSTDVRVVCMNTFKASELRTKGAGTSFTFKHTKSVMDRIEQAKDAIRGVREEHNLFVELANEMAQIQMREDQVSRFIESMIPMPTAAIEGVMITERVVNNVDTARAAVRSILNGPTTAEGHRDTGFGVWQAGIEYFDHVRGTRGNAQLSKFNRSIMSQPAIKTKLANLVREAVAA